MVQTTKILIALDELADAKRWGASLAKGDFQTEVAADRVDVLAKVAKFRPDLILLDAILPQLSGLEVCQQLKRDSATSRIKILMVTALQTLGDIERTVNAGADDFLGKPIYEVEMLHRLSNLVKS